MVTGVLGFILAICGLVIVNNTVNDLDQCFDTISADLQNNTNHADQVCGS